MSETVNFGEEVAEFEQDQKKRVLEPGENRGEVQHNVAETAAKKHVEHIIEEGNKLKLHDLAEQAAEAEPDNSSQQALETMAAMSEDEPQDVPRGVISREWRASMGKREMKNLQQQETWSERTLSRVIHQPVIRAVSEGAGKSVSRPSGLLGGGLVAFLGSGSYLAMAKYLHFNYNYSISLALFVGGFFFGLALELLVHLATASHRQVD